MAIIGFAGFDDRYVGASWPISAVYPIPVIGGSEDTQYSLACARGNFITSWSFAASKDPDLVDCVGLCLFSTSSSINIANHATFGPPLEGILPADLTLDRTGTWHWGCSVYAVATYAVAGTAIAIIGDTAALANTKPVYGYGMSAATYPDVYPMYNAQPAYIEFTIDWDAKMVYGYVNGKLCASLAFTGTPICQVGNLAKSGYTVGGQSFNNSLATPSYVPQISHVYLAVNPKGDPNPTPRLGSCRVRTAPLQTALAGDAKVFGTLTANGVLSQSRVAPNSTNWSNYIQLPSGSTQMEVKSTAVALPTTESVLAAKWSVINYKPSDQSAGLTLSVGDGINMGVPYKRVADLPGVEISKYMPKSPDGGAWTQTKLNSFTFRLGSYEL